eukprot:2145240-Prymnesium_polylepis.2
MSIHGACAMWGQVPGVFVVADGGWPKYPRRETGLAPPRGGTPDRRGCRAKYALLGHTHTHILRYIGTRPSRDP